MDAVMVDPNTKIVFSEKLYKRLTQITQLKDKGCHGFLLGKKKSNTLHVLTGVASKTTSLNHLKSAGIVSSTCLPENMELCGFFMQCGQSSFPAIIKTLLQKVLPPQMREFLGNIFLVWVFDSTEKHVSHVAYWYDIVMERVTPVEYELSSEYPFSKHMLVRMQGTWPISFDFTSREGLLKQRLAAAVQKIADEIRSDVSFYRVENSNVILGHDEEDTMTCLDLLQHIYVDGQDDRQRKKMLSDPSLAVINIQQLLLTTGDKAVARSIGGAPVIRHDHMEFTHVAIELPLDVLLVIDPAMPLSSLPHLLAEGTSKQLYQMRQCIIDYVQGTTFHTPQVYHFKPEDLGHFVSVIYPDDVAEDELEMYRQELNSRFILSPKKPVFKTSQSYRFPNDKASTPYLLNTHIGLPTSTVNGGKQYLVSGTYAYHHYMQDKVDDNGWGCAYRSLQTIVSWFRYQGYTDKPVPTHTHIQQILVDIGDKPENFVGSKRWIGSTEVSYVLENLLGVTSRILPVTNGAELGSKGRDLANHFEIQGTPVMIGGGVLAHTILGVDFNEVTGDLKFLILDPHYTGAEDLKIIQDKGWCGWKGPDFWDQTAFYNLCMPQRPDAI